MSLRVSTSLNRRWLVVSGWLAVLTLWCRTPAVAQDPQDLLVRALTASESASFVGEQITTVSWKGRTHQTRQRVLRQGARLRIEYLEPGPVRGRVVVDDGVAARFYFPQLQLVLRGESRVGQASRLSREREIREVQRGHVIASLEEPGVVAGRSTYAVSVKPPEGRRYESSRVLRGWHKFQLRRDIWIDRETYVILRVREEMGGRVTTTEFTQIDFRTIPPESAFRLDVPPDTQEVPAQFGLPISLTRARLVAQRWGGLFLPTYLPPYCRYRAAFRMQHRGEPVVVLLYANSRASVSFFQTKGNVPLLPGGHTRMAGLSVLQSIREDVNLTVLGSLPEAELRKMLDSVQRSSEEGTPKK